MKIDVITIAANGNYGSMLQAFATQKFFAQHGVDARIIDIASKSNKLEYLKYLCTTGRKITVPFKILPAIIAMYAVQKVFGKFKREYLRMSDNKLNPPEEYKSDADAFCTGSDQVWNPISDERTRAIMHLSFAPENSYKFAFASSFGVPELPPEAVKATQKYIDSYKHISVREDSGLKILNEQYNYYDAIQILDPTLCLDGNTWRKYAKYTNGGGGGYILIYALHIDKRINSFASQLAKKTGLKLIRICSSWRQFNQNIFRLEKKIILPDVFRFISLVDNARYVVTNSFHGTAFALNLNTEPFCIYPAQYNDFTSRIGRIQSILKLTKSEHCLIKSDDDFDVVNRPVNFAQVNSILDAERKKASDWLKMVLAEIELAK